MFSKNSKRTIGRLLKVNYAGEHGAIRIYASQISVSRLFWPDLVAQLSEMRGHEIEHHRLFVEAMPTREARPCRLLFLWAWGGAMLGFSTALLGRRMIWACTEAVESAVHDHLADQLVFLERNDPELRKLIASIQLEEVSHLAHAQANGGAPTATSKFMIKIIGLVTDVLIFAATSGDSLRLKRELNKGNN